jgi:hypothetical protein
MNYRIFLYAILPFLIGCAAFKQLEPDPEIISSEGKYIELKDDDEFFELDKDKKYFIEFPPPMTDNFYLLVNVTQKDAIVAGMADRFDKDKGILSRIDNEAAADANEFVYSVNPTVQKFYWAIEKVSRDMVIEMSYRYLPKWRYKFETQYESFQQILKENRVSRVTYENIGGSVSFREFDFSTALAELDKKTLNLESLFQQLVTIESLLPETIKNSSDEAYQNYIALKNDIDEEIKFQKNYSLALKTFQLELKTRNDMPAFAKALPEFLKFYDKKESFPANVLTEANRIFEARLDELTPHFDEHVRNKNNYDPVALNIDQVNSLYEATGALQSPDYKALASFIKDYNSKAQSLIDVRSAIENLNQKVNSKSDWPDNNFFSGIQTELNGIAADLPSAGFSGHAKYQSVKSVKFLNNAINSLRGEVIQLQANYKQAQGVVSQLNRYGDDRAYQQMIQLINQNGQLKFLKKMYADLDNKSLTQQESTIKSALNQENWQRAEDGLRGLHTDRDFLNLASIQGKKASSVKAMEDTLMSRVERVTAKKVDVFVNEKYGELNNVEALYQSPVFNPAWNITFTSGSKAELDSRKARLNERLKSLKEVVFPQKAIEFLYKDFSNDINSNGVLKARAIVVHGQQYKGTDNKIKNLVAECDPWASKWITKEVQYRKVYALPTTTNPSGENTYVFRLNLRIPTDARFPAYDVNIKLPKDVAQKASGAWYDQIMMNKEVLKPEGRFTITAPNASNEYTALITPLQVVKDGDSILEVRFTHSSFKVFEVSVMAQKPILRKN